MKYNTPGLFFTPETKRISKLKLEQKCVTGFIGITERGPLNKGVRISSFYQFKQIFGNFTDYSYLPFSIYGFFACGGEECIVVRVAHKDKELSSNSATISSLDIMDPSNKKISSFETLSEGTWGNHIQVKLQHIYSKSIAVTEIDKKNKSISLLENRDYKENEWIRILGEDASEFIQIEKAEDNEIILKSAIKNSYKIDEHKTICEKVNFNITFIGENELEEYKNLASNPLDDRFYVNIINDHSNIVKVTQELDKKDTLPKEILYKNLSHGKNGVMGLTPKDFIGTFIGLGKNEGIGIFEEFNDISLLTAPDLLLFEEYIDKDEKAARDNIYIIQKAMIDQCEKLGDRFAILDAPLTKEILELSKWRKKFDTNTAALYYPRIEMVNPVDMTGINSVVIPPSGHIAGIYAKCDKTEGVFRAPANKYIDTAVGLENTINNEEYELIYPQGINCLNYIPGKGIKVWGARTLSSDISWRYINIRRTFTKVKEALQEGMGWAVFEPNTLSLRKRIIRHVTAFMLDLWYKGYFMGKIPEEAFLVKCDDELNPPEEIDAGRINVEIGIAIAKPAEFLVIRLNANVENSLISLAE